jgi:serine/threonine protein kinase
MWEPVITDLGLALVHNRKARSLNGSYGVIPYMAPEILQGEPHSKASDIYALGMIMWELSAGVPPFNNRCHKAKLMLDIFSGLRPRVLDRTPKCWVQLMQECWDSDPSKRPTIKVVYETIKAWRDKDDYEEVFPWHREQDRIKQKKTHKNAVYTSRFIPSISALRAYAKEKNIKISELDDEWDNIVSNKTGCFIMSTRLVLITSCCTIGG